MLLKALLAESLFQTCFSLLTRLPALACDIAAAWYPGIPAGIP